MAPSWNSCLASLRHVRFHPIGKVGRTVAMLLHDLRQFTFSLVTIWRMEYAAHTILDAESLAVPIGYEERRKAFVFAPRTMQTRPAMMLRGRDRTTSNMINGRLTNKTKSSPAKISSLRGIDNPCDMVILLSAVSHANPAISSANGVPKSARNMQVIAASRFTDWHVMSPNFGRDQVCRNVQRYR